MHPRTVLSVIGLVGAACGVVVAGTEVARHEIRVTLDPDQARVSGEALLTLTRAAPRILELYLGLDYRLEAVEEITDRPSAEGGERATQAEGCVLGEPRRGRRPGETTTVNVWPVRLAAGPPGRRLVRVRWSGGPPALPDSARFSRDEISEPLLGYLAPEGAFLAADSCWHPTGGQATSAFRVEATVPARWRVVSEGQLADVSEPAPGWRREVYDGAHLLEGVNIVAAPWRVSEQRHGDTRLAVYTLPDTPPELSAAYLEAIRGYLDRFSRRFGPHPWPQFVVAEHILPTGYGMPSFTLLGAQVMRLPFIIKTSLGHEVLHDWWGNGVYVDPAGGNWCEGLTSYFADHAFAGEQAPGGEIDYRRQILRDYVEYVAREGVEPAVADFREREDRGDRALGYGKALMVFHMLRRHIGDEAFDRALVKFFADFKFSRAGWRDLEAAFSSAAGQPLGWFFQQWVESPGAPEIAFGASAVTAERRGESTLVSAHVAVSPGWRLTIPVALRLELAGGGRWEGQATASLREGAARAEALAPGVVISGSAILDPEVDVFRRLGPGEAPAALSRLLAASPDLVVLGAGRSPAIQSAARLLAQQLAGDRAVLRPDNEVGETDLRAARTAWVVGRPAANTAVARWLQRQLAADGALNEAQLKVGAAEAAGPGAALCIVLEHGVRGQGALGVLDALSAAALESLGRRIGHYGKYSRLLFADERAIVKDVAPGAAPSVSFTLPR